jgi:L-glyceraldehyde 3-phosphate reductase
MGLQYVDIFYSHRYDPLTPLEETMGALDYIVRSGRALYAGLSNYPPEKFIEAVEILRSLGTPCLVDQIRYSMLVQERGEGLFGLHRQHGVGCVSFSPLAQGVLTDRYLNGIPTGSRAAREESLHSDFVCESLPKVKALNEIAAARGQSLAEMAIAWQLIDERVTSVIVGVSSPTQLEDNLRALENTSFTAEEIGKIDHILK